mgnify:FL=1
MPHTVLLSVFYREGLILAIDPSAYGLEDECGLMLPFLFFISFSGLAPTSETEVVKSTPVQEHSDFP